MSQFAVVDAPSILGLSPTLGVLMASGQAVGITITIFNPKLDPDGSIASKFSQSVIAGLS